MAENLPRWNERVTAFSIYPDHASPADVARIAAELMECQEVLIKVKAWCERFNLEGSLIYKPICEVLKSCDL